MGKTNKTNEDKEKKDGKYKILLVIGVLCILGFYILDEGILILIGFGLIISYYVIPRIKNYEKGFDNKKNGFRQN